MRSGTSFRVFVLRMKLYFKKSIEICDSKVLLVRTPSPVRLQCRRTPRQCLARIYSTHVLRMIGARNYFLYRVAQLLRTPVNQVFYLPEAIVRLIEWVLSKPTAEKSAASPRCMMQQQTNPKTTPVAQTSFGRGKISL